MARIWDISQTLREALPVWPGDTPFQARRHWVMDDQCPVNVGRFQLSAHAGTHADAPLHYDPEGCSVAQVDLAAYIGPCVLIDVTRSSGLVRPGDLVDHLPRRLERVLLRTFARFPHDHWEDEFTAVAPETIAMLAERGVRLIGVDSPSLDPQDSKSMAAHQAVRRHGMAILEGLVLDDVPVGHYELIAPPLKLEGLDASPVRALLRSL